MYKEFRKTATVKAKLFEKGDEDGMTWTKEKLSEGWDDRKYGFKPPIATIPYIKTLENQQHLGEFGNHYVCIGIDGERWLVDKDIFERTYEAVS
jgi:hypothetical protein